jgi:hypothetical protein
LRNTTRRTSMTALRISLLLAIACSVVTLDTALSAQWSRELKACVQRCYDQDKACIKASKNAQRCNEQGSACHNNCWAVCQRAKTCMTP